MTNLAQFILLIVIVTLTFLIAFVAIQVFHILHDFRQVLKRVDGVLDKGQHQDLVTELKSIVHESESEIIQKTAQRIQTQVEKKNVFRRAGMPLRPS